jgi:predicted amidophosphoribosyltransferase
MTGVTPLPWWGSGAYAGALRELVLQLRREPRASTVGALSAGLAPAFKQAGPPPQLVAIPGWKRRGNPLPGLLCRETARRYGLRQRALLQRSHPVLGQHHLNRRQRLANQRGAFRCVQPPRPGEARRHPLLIVDDILTTGATACSAAEALRLAGWRVAGLLCLARTPGSRRGGGTGPMPPGL